MNGGAAAGCGLRAADRRPARSRHPTTISSRTLCDMIDPLSIVQEPTVILRCLCLRSRLPAVPIGPRQVLIGLRLAGELERLRIELERLSGEARSDIADDDRFGERPRVAEVRRALLLAAAEHGVDELRVVIAIG